MRVRWDVDVEAVCYKIANRLGDTKFECNYFDRYRAFITMDLERKNRGL